jgi:transposase InsO family protein
MPWQEASTVSLREEFVALAGREGANVRALCRAYGISPKTGYKWLGRYRAEGAAGLADRPRRPRTSPGRAPAEVEARVLALRDEHPAWGGRKLRRRLLDLGEEAPAASTVTEILRRHGRLDPAAAAAHAPWRRFERAAPNELWQIDFHGPHPLAAGRCEPLLVLDDHSRFALGLVACADQREPTVRAALEAIFRRYGLPWALLADHGHPWAAPQPEAPLTRLGAWLVRLGVAPVHGRPRHPQTQGKVERFGRTLGAEVLAPARCFPDLAAAQAAFDAWRDTYNLERPHEACALAPPASRYRPSPRPFPEALPPIVYEPGDTVRTVRAGGQIQLRGRWHYVGLGVAGEPVALRPTATDGVLDVYYCHHRLRQLDLRRPGAG